MEDTIQIKKESISSGSCMACTRYIDSGDELKPIYPYTEVYTLYVGDVSRLHMRFCDECIKKLKDKVDKALSATK